MIVNSFVPFLAAVLTVFLAETLSCLPFCRTKTRRFLVYLVGLVVVTAVMRAVVAAWILRVLNDGMGAPMNAARRDNVSGGTVLQFLSAAAALVAARWGVATCQAAVRSSKVGLAALSAFLFLLAMALGFLTFLAWFGTNSW